MRGHLEQTRSRSAGSNRLGPNVLITSLSSVKPVCGEPYPRTFLISIIGGRIDRSDNGDRAVRKTLGLRLSGNAEIITDPVLGGLHHVYKLAACHVGRVLTRCPLRARGAGPARPLAHLSVPGCCKLRIVGISPFVNFAPFTTAESLGNAKDSRPYFCALQPNPTPCLSCAALLLLDPQPGSRPQPCTSTAPNETSCRSTLSSLGRCL
jgi:hypothetical protein